MAPVRYSSIIVAIILQIVMGNVIWQVKAGDCYTNNNTVPKVCLTPFTNVAYHKSVIASNTCGTPPSTFCILSAGSTKPKSCLMCNASATNPMEYFPARYITDGDRQTWWQSQTLLNNNKPIWVEIDLGKSYEITYININFKTMRPKSFKISKQLSGDSNWIPYQYYSSSCSSTYNVRDYSFNFGRDQKVAMCTSRYSGMFPTSNGRISFSTLAGRQGVYNFENDINLQDWVTAVAIRIDLDEMNTFGDEYFGDETVLKSYYYGISVIDVAGRCKCNGHASECVMTQDTNGKSKLACRCQHGTAGDDCEKCAPLYNDKPWRRATRSNANACARCECNGMADSCVFDEKLYAESGSGGRCINCKANTDGVNCEKCKVGFYRNSMNYCQI